MPHKVMQWATGSIGRAQLQAVVEDPGLARVGVKVFGASKVGLDAGELCGLGDTGVIATDSSEAVLALEAGVVLHAATKYGPYDTNADDIEALLISGKNVITTTTYNHLPTYGRGAGERFEAACRKGSTSFLAAGENPGFMMQRLATTLTGLSKSVEHIAVEEYYDVTWLDAPSMLFDGMMMGSPPELFTVDAPMMAKNSMQYRQEIAATAEMLGLDIERIEPSIEVATIDRDLTIAAGVVRRGTVVGAKMAWTGFSRGRPRLTIRQLWLLTRDLPQWGIDTIEGFKDRSFIRIVVEGEPNFELGLRIGLDPQRASKQGTSAEHLMIAMSAVRAIDAVVSAPPGIVRPSVFASYRYAEGV